MPPSQPRHLVPLQLLIRHGRNVDVEQHRLRPGIGQLPHHQLARHTHRRVQVRIALVHQREGDGGHTQQVAFGGGCHRAGIDGVVAHVGAVVNARDHQVRRPVQQAGDGHVHAVGGRAIDEMEAVGCLAHRQRPAQRERVGRARTVALRREDDDFSQIGQRAGQRLDARRKITVIITDQYPHRLILSMPGRRLRDTPLQRRIRAPSQSPPPWVLFSSCGQSRI